jgi:LPXTG-motif cell wall-anchored protein
MISFAVIFIGALLVAIGSLGNAGSMGGGTIILIGPIPIIIGTGSYSPVLIALGLAVTILAALFYVLLRRRK